MMSHKSPVLFLILWIFPFHSAGAGTFYSALSNIHLRIEEGNPSTVALSTHYAQHSFVSHCDIKNG